MNHTMHYHSIIASLCTLGVQSQPWKPEFHITNKYLYEGIAATVAVLQVS